MVSESGQEVFLIVFRLDFDSSDQTPLRASKILRFQAPKRQKQNPSKIARCARQGDRSKAAKWDLAFYHVQKVNIPPK